MPDCGKGRSIAIDGTGGRILRTRSAHHDADGIDALDAVKPRGISC